MKKSVGCITTKSFILYKYLTDNDISAAVATICSSMLYAYGDLI